jgi:hypothetical protein
VGIHKAAIYKKNNFKILLQKGEGIIFINDVIEHAKDFEIELVPNKFSRLINNTSIDIDKR